MLPDPARTDRFAAAFTTHLPQVMRFSFLLAGDRQAAQDIAQETFLRIAGHINRLSDDELWPYLRATCLNVWRSDLRRRRLELELIRQLWQLRGAATEPSPEEALERHDMIWAVIRKLPLRQRACLVLRYYEDLPESAVAELLDCRVGTVKSQTSRALAKVRKAVAHGVGG